jgi:hypothetical protein
MVAVVPRSGLGRPHRRFPGERNFSLDSIDLQDFVGPGPMITEADATFCASIG